MPGVTNRLNTFTIREFLAKVKWTNYKFLFFILGETDCRRLLVFIIYD